ncbi:MAG: hypothetical protein AAF594_10515, partial [Bacteroidota bacterium]
MEEALPLLEEHQHLLVEAARGEHQAEHALQLVGLGQGTVQPRQTKLRVGIGAQLIRPDTVMADIKFWMECNRKGVALPHRRALAKINSLQIGKIHAVARMHDKRRMFGRRKLRIEANR